MPDTAEGLGFSQREPHVPRAGGYSPPASVTAAGRSPGRGWGWRVCPAEHLKLSHSSCPALVPLPCVFQDMEA